MDSDDDQVNISFEDSTESQIEKVFTEIVEDLGSDSEPDEERETERQPRDNKTLAKNPTSRMESFF